MNYTETLKYIENTGKLGSILGLDSIKTLLDILGNPQDKVKAVHVTGTNGKGSVMAYLTAIFENAGMKVGRYTSPAVFDYGERFYITDDCGSGYISKEDMAKVFTIVESAVKKMVQNGKPHPTIFEIETAVAFEYFYEKSCDIVLVEVGMGGETDATNVIKEPVCSVISSVSMDHMQFLGDSLEKIAKVKSGIIKKNRPVVVIEQKPEVVQVIKEVAAYKNSPLFIAKEPAKYLEYELQIKPSLLGVHQKDNAILAAKAAEVVFMELKNTEKDRENSIKKNTENGTENNTDNLCKTKEYFVNCIEKGISKAYHPGRLEKINESPDIYIDGAHNPDAAKRLAQSLQLYFTNRDLVFIMGVLADKDYNEVCKNIVPMAKAVITVTPDNERALDAKKLAKTVSNYNKNVFVAGSLDEALETAYKVVSEDAVIVAFGSLSYLGEFKKVVKLGNKMLKP